MKGKTTRGGSAPVAQGHAATRNVKLPQAGISCQPLDNATRGSLAGVGVLSVPILGVCLLSTTGGLDNGVPFMYHLRYRLGWPER